MLGKLGMLEGWGIDQKEKGLMDMDNDVVIAGVVGRGEIQDD